MAKFWKYLKNAVLIWGFISLAILIVIVVSITISNNIRDKESAGVSPETFQKSSGDISLRATEGEGEEKGIFLDLSKGTAPLATKYQLPTKEYDLGWIKVTDASIVRVSDDEYRIVLYTSAYVCDHESDQFIWMLKWKGKLDLITMISLSDLYKASGAESVMLGNKSIYLTSFGATKPEHVTIPIKVQIGDVIKITPMLDQESIRMVKTNLGKEIDARMEMLSKSNNTGLLREYEKSKKALSESLSVKTIPF